MNLWRVASCSSAPWFDEAVPQDMPTGPNIKSSSKKRTGSESSNDSGFGDGINGDDDEDGALYSKSHLLASAETGDKMTSDPPDIKVKAIDQHEDSVYGVAWSACDAWMFCSLSYEGRLVSCHVHKANILRTILTEYSFQGYPQSCALNRKI